MPELSHKGAAQDMTGPELRVRRKALGLPQVKLAELLGTTQHTISRWEEGKIELSPHRSLWLDVEMKRVERLIARRQALAAS